MQTRAQIDKQLCKCIVGGAECLKFRDPVTAKRNARLALIARLATCGFCCHLSSGIIPAVRRFTPAVLLSLYQGISSHQIFLAVYKTLISLSRLGFILCKRSIFFPRSLLFLFFVFPPGFSQSPGRSLGSCLKYLFFFLPPSPF